MTLKDSLLRYMLPAKGLCEGHWMLLKLQERATRKGRGMKLRIAVVFTIVSLHSYSVFRFEALFMINPHLHSTDDFVNYQLPHSYRTLSNDLIPLLFSILTHISNPADHPRFPTLNVTAEMSPAMFFTHPATAASNGLMNWDFPSHFRHNAHLTIGSDWGVPEFPDLFPAMAGIVERVGNGDKTKGAETLLRCLTLAGAEAVGREGELGSIETGKVGNFIVVDRDLSLGLFEGAKVLKTYFEGEVVWDAEF